jgi:ABC-type Zn2+ transport system substrate-binding protein/surface adhesin
VGYIIDIDGDRVTLETSVGASFVVLKQYVLRKIEPVVPVDDEFDDEFDADDAGDDEADDAEEHDDDDDHGHDAADEVDDDHDETGVAEPEPEPEPGNRRARRRGMRPKATEVEDSGGDDTPPII